MRIAALLALSLALLVQADSIGYFAPSHRVSGVGVARDDISADLLEARTDLMVQSQTFSIMREPLAVEGAHRITTNVRLQAAFRNAAKFSGLPATLIEAIAYLESWGDPKAESPTGPKGVMQISHGHCARHGLAGGHRHPLSRDQGESAGQEQERKDRGIRR